MSEDRDIQRGDAWATGGLAMTLFNTVATPNSSNHSWAYCGLNGSGTMATYSNADSHHSGGVNVLMAEGRVQFIKDSVNRTTWWGLERSPAARSPSKDSRGVPDWLMGEGSPKVPGVRRGGRSAEAGEGGQAPPQVYVTLGAKPRNRPHRDEAAYLLEAAVFRTLT